MASAFAGDQAGGQTLGPRVEPDEHGITFAPHGGNQAIGEII